jgi:hypothetical protein
MDNHHADRSGILPSLTTVFNIVAARLKLFADRSVTGKPGDFLTQHPRVIVASLTSRRNSI